MAPRSSLGLLGLTGAALLAGLLSTVACAAPAPDEDARGAASSVTERPFDRNAVLDDKSMREPVYQTLWRIRSNPSHHHALQIRDVVQRVQFLHGDASCSCGIWKPGLEQSEAAMNVCRSWASTASPTGTN